MNGLLKPTHYENMAIKPQEYIAANKLTWNQGNVVKYVSRYQFKNGMEDIKKAMTYLAFILKEDYGVETEISYEDKV